MPTGPGHIDDNGIWQYGEDDPIGSLFSDFLNLGQGATSAALGTVDTRLDTVEGKLADTGWITPTLNAGWTPAAGETPAYRRLNGIVYRRGRATSTGAQQYAYLLPAGFRPGMNTLQYTDANGSAVRAITSSGGGVGQVAAAAATSFSFGGLVPFIAEL